MSGSVLSIDLALWQDDLLWRRYTIRIGYSLKAGKRIHATRMIDGLRPIPPCALLKGLVRLGVNFARTGEKFRGKSSISMLYEGD
jgi:hypothetical protein